MAHEIDFSTGRAGFAFTGNRGSIWHKLGQEIDPARATDIDYLLDAGGLRWAAEKLPLRYTFNGSEREVPDAMANIRTDTGACLGIVSESKYNNVQPRQVVEFFRDFLGDNKLSISTLGSIKGGRVVWSLAKLGPDYDFMLPGGDKINSYLRLQTSFDGSRATTATVTRIRQVCANTEAAIEATTRETQYRCAHSAAYDAAALQRAIGLLGEQHHVTAAIYNALTARQVSDAEARQFFYDLLEVSPEDAEKNTISGRTRNKLVALGRAYSAGPGANLASSRGTAYGLLNAVTYFADHEAKGRDTLREGRDVARAASAAIGAGNKVKQRAASLALALAA